MTRIRDIVRNIVDGIVERRAREATSVAETLRFENECLVETNAALETRVASLEAALDRVLEMFHSEWVGPDQLAVMRTARAVLEDESWRK